VKFDTLGIQNFYFVVSDVGGYPWKVFKQTLHDESYQTCCLATLGNQERTLSRT